MSDHPSVGTHRLGLRAVLRGAVGYLALVVVLVLLGMHPSPLLLGAGALTLGGLLAYLDVAMGTDDPPWPCADISTRGLGRGSDHRTASLARRLAGAPESSAGARQHLAEQVRADLVAAVVSRVGRSHGLDPTTDPRVLPLLPPDVAALVSEPADERLLDPHTLTRLLDRIEQL